jgi:hypothetical protein
MSVIDSRISAISIRQPWAWMIVHGHKRVENRSWRCSHWGPLYIHAGVACTRDDWESAKRFILEHAPEAWAAMESAGVTHANMPKGGLVGKVMAKGCQQRVDDPWFVGPWGLLLSEPVELAFIPCKGALGFFKPLPTPEDRIAIQQELF